MLSTIIKYQSITSKIYIHIYNDKISSAQMCDLHIIYQLLFWQEELVIADLNNNTTKQITPVNELFFQTLGKFI